MTYRKDFREFEREAYWTLPRLALFGCAGVALAFLASIVLSPFGILARVAHPDKVLSNYEFFHDASNNYKVRLSQVRERSSQLKAETDPDERRRMRIEVNAASQACRDTAARYNAAAAKLNVGLFRANSLPETLPAGACDVVQ